MHGAIKEQRSPFLERWATAEAINGRLMVSVVVLTTLCGVLTMSLIYTALKPKSIYYIPSSQEAGIAIPNSLPPSAVEAFAVSWVLSWTNFTPVTVDEVYSKAQRFMSPRLLAKTRSRLTNDVAQVKGDKISSLFSVQGDPVLEKNERGYMVHISGQKGYFAGEQLISNKSMTYHVILRRVNPTDQNPYGLMIEDIDQDLKENP